MQKIWEWAEEKLTSEEKCNKLLITTDHKERTVWHVAANCNILFVWRVCVSRLKVRISRGDI